MSFEKDLTAIMEDFGSSDNYGKMADDANLSGETKTTYVTYMKKRWPKGQDMSYASEWAGRFAKGTEWDSSDKEGQAILKSIDAKYGTDAPTEKVIEEELDELATKALIALEEGSPIKEGAKEYKDRVTKAGEDKENADVAAKAKATAEMKSILRKIHQAVSVDEIETALDRLSKSSIKHDLADGKIALIKGEAERKEKKLKAAEETAKVEEDAASEADVTPKIDEPFVEAKVDEGEGTPVYLRDLSSEMKAQYKEEDAKLNPDGGKDVIVGYYIQTPKVDEAKKTEEK